MVSFIGIPSVIDRTLFTKKGPITKRPVELLIGSNLIISGIDQITIPTGNFNSSGIGKNITISGSLNERNDGTYVIDSILSSTKLKLKDVNFDLTDITSTINSIIALSNEIRLNYEAHRVQTSVHGTNDIINSISVSIAVDLTSSLVLLNDLKTKILAHLIDVSADPPVHLESDENLIFSPAAHDLGSALRLVNEIRKIFEIHRQDKFIHVNSDLTNITSIDFISPTLGTYPSNLTGPFNWTYSDPLIGKIADESYDVSVLVNGLPVTVEAVFGLLGAVVLQDKPLGPDSVTIDYNYIKDPPSKCVKLNSFEYVLNQDKALGYNGIPTHRYPVRSHLINPVDYVEDIVLGSAFQPIRIGHKYKALERKYTAVLNDPNTLLLNVPTNKVTYPVLFKQQTETTVNYDPIVLPQNAIDPWQLKGVGVFSLASGGNSLSILDNIDQTGLDSFPPFFTKQIKIESASIISAAFRVSIDNEDLKTDGVFTGVSFGLSDGQKAIVAGFLLTEANNLSSALSLVNSIKGAFNRHILYEGPHNPSDFNSTVTFVNATNEESLIVLVNNLKLRYNNHLGQGGGVGLVHKNVDSLNDVTFVDAVDLNTAILLVNDIRNKFNSHLTQSLTHFENDLINSVNLVKQVGILTNETISEFDTSWSSYAVNWDELKTYRIFRNADGDAELYLSGDINPVISVAFQDLVSFSDLDADFEEAQQVFFGSIAREAASLSHWQFIRVDISPVTFNLIENNKAIDYDSSVIPQLDSTAPWVDIGQGGDERILTGNLLSIDSTSSASNQDVDNLGLTTGAYKGYLRLEPILSDDTSISIEFKTAIDYYTFGIDNRACGLVIDDNNLSVQFAFLQLDPSAATATGTTASPFSLINNDNLVLQFGNTPQISIIFISPIDNSVIGIINEINSQLGFAFASDVGGKIKFSSPDLGSGASFTLLKGSALSKLGLSAGTYIGRDSNPEPRISWFGADVPNEDVPIWNTFGEQNVELLGRTLRITDQSILGYKVYTQSDSTITVPVFNSAEDWKLDVRLRIRSFIPGDTLTALAPYSDSVFAGALTSVDEGPGGKNIELHLSVTTAGTPILNLLSFNDLTQRLDIVTQFAFNWNDGQVHSYNIFTSKTLNMIFVYADAVLLTPIIGPAPTYIGLNSGIFGPSISFGSGAEPVINLDLRTTVSVVDWESVAIFRDSKINDITASTRRYIGIYKGGDTNQINSYYLHQIDWSVLHTYRIVRSPTSSVSVYVDGDSTPVISAAYDVLTLPPATSSYLTGITGDSSVIAFNSFNPQEISRTRWEFIRYSVGKINLTNLLVPPHQVLNQGNAIVSPDHLYTKKIHSHQAFRVYSGGTPLDEFMADPEVNSYTVLGEGIPIVPQTQNLESRFGLRKTATVLNSIPSVDVINTRGFLANLENDDNTITSNSILEQLISSINIVRSSYEEHRVNISYHVISDILNPITAVIATDIFSAINLVNNLKSVYNDHLIQGGIHSVNDVTNTVVALDASNIETAINLYNDLAPKFNSHLSDILSHLTADSVNLLSIISLDDPLTSSLSLLNEIRNDYLSHLEKINVHLSNDVINNKISEEATDLNTAIEVANQLKSEYNKHISGVIFETQKIHSTDDVVNIVTENDAFDLTGLTLLIVDLRDRYNAHLIQDSVHAATLFIRLDAPSRVLYEGMKFWGFPNSGIENQIASFSDCGSPLSFNQNYFGYHSFSYDGDIIPEDEQWKFQADDASLVSTTLLTSGSDEFLRYGTGGPVKTAYTIDSGSHPSLDFEISFSIRIFSHPCALNIDTDMYAGFVSPIGPGVAAGLGFSILNNIPHINIQDVNINQPLYQIPFNWADGAFHTYKIIRDVKSNSLRLMVIS